MALAVCCDMRIATPDKSKFGDSGGEARSRLRLAKGLKRLMDMVGPSFTKEIFFTARQFDAEEARMMGLVNRVVPAAELENYVKDYAGDDRRQCAAHHRRCEIQR